jgi:NADH-quinone oxidoreductase subunit L
MIYSGALQRGLPFYLAALVGSFFTAASFLKLGHSAFLGRSNLTNSSVKEAPWSMLIPMIVIASICVIFGLYNQSVVGNFIEPVLGGQIEQIHDSSEKTVLVAATVMVLIVAVLHHIFAAKAAGAGYKASDHIHYAPLLGSIYNLAEKRFFDPYDILLKIVNGVSKALWVTDRVIDGFYNSVSVYSAYTLGRGIRRAHTGNYSLYVAWSLAGAILVLIMLLK